MHPAGFVAKYKPSIDEGRRSPDRGLRAISPIDFAFIRSQGIQVTVARSDVHSAIRNDRARPEATLLFARSTQRLVLPKQLAVTLAEAIDDAILSGRVDFAFVHCGRGI